MRILMASPELVPLAKVGGLGDMVGSLSRALSALGHDVRCALPHYKAAEQALPKDTKVVDRKELRFPFRGSVTRVGLTWVEAESLPARVLLVGHPLFDRDGIYGDPVSGQGYGDNGTRWAVFSRGVQGALFKDDWFPDVVHAHDHQAAPLLGLMRWSTGPGRLPRRPALVFTIHNAAFQGIESPQWVSDAALPWDLYYSTGPLEYHGNVNLMKIGLEASHQITTVSPRYAKEICTSEEFSGGLQGAFEARADRLTGIVNGIDEDLWDPSKDPHIQFHYTSKDLQPKSRNRTALRKELGLERGKVGVPLLAMVSRLTSQKGIDLLLDVIDPVIGAGTQMVVLGSGEQRYQVALKKAALRHPGKLVVKIGFSEPLAHRIEAAADIFVMPSRFEPCGLNQLYSLRYGTVPVVRAVGGLADTVIDLDEFPERANGFVFRMQDGIELYKTIHRALRAFKNRKLWRELVERGMEGDYSWSRSADAYVEVYRKAQERT